MKPMSEQHASFAARYRLELRDARVAIAANLELGATFSAAGLTIETPLSKIELAWTGVRRIQRRRGAWTFTSRAGNRFSIPTRAIPVDERAPIARWATAGKARLD